MGGGLPHLSCSPANKAPANPCPEHQAAEGSRPSTCHTQWSREGRDVRLSNTCQVPGSAPVLHTNPSQRPCSHCHRPVGSDEATGSDRSSTSLEDTQRARGQADWLQGLCSQPPGHSSSLCFPEQGSANFLYTGPESKYFWLCVISANMTQLCCRQYVNSVAVCQ